MKFGKRLKDLLIGSLPEYHDKFLSYKELKKLLKSLPSGDVTSPAPGNAPDDGIGSDAPLPRLEDASNGGSGMTEELFVKLLNDELEKFNCFFMEKEEEFVIRMQVLREEMERLKSTCPDGDLIHCNGCGGPLNGLRRAIVSLHGEMVLLENYSALNYTGLVKILKKHDKRTGLLLRYPFISTVLRQPFLTTDILSKLVKECEDRIQLLFPSQPSGSRIGEREAAGSCIDPERIRIENQGEGEDRESPPSSPDSDSRHGAGSTADGDVQAVYRSALTALRSLQDIRGSSKTPHPLLAEMGSFPGVTFQRPKESASSADTTQFQGKCSVTSTAQHALGEARLGGANVGSAKAEKRNSGTRFQAPGAEQKAQGIACQNNDDGAESSRKKRLKTEGGGCSGSSGSQNSCRNAVPAVLGRGPPELPS